LIQFDSKELVGVDARRLTGEDLLKVGMDSPTMFLSLKGKTRNDKDPDLKGRE
jgi:hypothetical protein